MISERLKRRSAASLFGLLAAACVTISGCQPDSKADRADDNGVVDFRGDYTEPSNTRTDQTGGAAEAQRPSNE